MDKKVIIVILAGVLALCGPTAAKKLHVPGQYATIQEAIDAASDGDTVIVADGTYTGPGNRDIDFLGKAITVRSESGPENCVIDCNGTEAERHRGFRFGNNEDANSVVDGFTIINGYAPEEPFGGDWRAHGGAIFCSSSSPTVSNCVIKGNTARAGAGIYSEYSTSTFNNCTVSTNHGTGSSRLGCGIICLDSNSTISNCTVNGNEGGGIHCGGGNPVITNCIASYNKGLGIHCGGSNPTIANCTVTGNSPEYTDGAGISVNFCGGTVTDCNISYNRNTEWGGGAGINAWGSSTTISRCTIVGNSTFYGGGGIYCYESSNITIADCVITGNYVKYGASGIDCEHSDATITNCIISSNLGWGVRIDAYSRAIISGCTISMNEEAGIVGSFSNATIMNCIISGNMAGGIIWYRGRWTTTIANCAISGNSGEHAGGIYATDHSSVRLANCTISDNKAKLNGGGVCCDRDSNTVLANCILWGNTASDGNQIAVLPDDRYGDESTLTITYSDVQGGEDDAYVRADCELNWGIGNIDAEPWFVEAGYWDANGTPGDANDDFWVEGDYRLLDGSPCIDSGDPNYAAGPNETDLDGKARVIDGDEDGTSVVDMGAYEYIAPLEVEMTIVPRALNCGSKGKWVKAHIAFPEEILPGDIDMNEPAVAEPMGVESEYMKVVGRSEGPVMLEIGFERGAFCEAAGGAGEVEVTVVGWLTDGREFYGTDTIKLKSDQWRHRRVKRLR